MTFLIQKTRAGIVWSIFSTDWLEWTFGITVSLTPGLQKGIGVSLGPFDFSAYTTYKEAMK